MSAAVEAAATGIANSIQSSVDGINTVLQGAFDTVNRIPGVDIDVYGTDCLPSNLTKLYM